MKLWRERTAFTSCGTTVSSYPIIPGKMVSPERSLAIRLSRSSSLTLRARSLCSEKELFRSSPRVRGRFMKGPLNWDYTPAGAVLDLPLVCDGAEVQIDSHRPVISTEHEGSRERGRLSVREETPRMVVATMSIQGVLPRLCPRSLHSRFPLYRQMPGVRAGFHLAMVETQVLLSREHLVSAWRRTHARDLSTSPQSLHSLGVGRDDSLRMGWQARELTTLSGNPPAYQMLMVRSAPPGFPGCEVLTVILLGMKLSPLYSGSAT